MAALVCPNYNSEEWKKLTEKLGEDTLPAVQQVKSMKMFMENGEDTLRALAKVNPDLYSPREKEEKLKTLSNSVVFVDTPDPTTGQPRHEYRTRSGEVLISVSRKLDENPALKYRGEDTGMLYSDSGTKVHSVFEQFATGVRIENVQEYADKNGIPSSVVAYASSFISSLQQTGVVLSEVNLRDPSYPVAGRADIIHVKHDGTVDIYDIKTAYRTPSKVVNNKKIWNPLQDYEGYKSQRYTAQLEYYAQMVEKTIGHPVSNAFILPIEVEFTGNLPTNPISSITPLSPENTISYGYQRRARQFVDSALGVKRSAPLPGLSTIDDSSGLVTRLTGIIQNVSPDLDSQAEEMLIPSRGFVRNRGGHLQYRKGTDWVSLRSTDRAAQKQQIISEYLSQQERTFRDIEPSVKNYIETGKDVFLSSRGQSMKNLRTILDSYRGLNYTVTSLSDISGLEDKKSWLLIRKDEKTDLLYIGNEELDRPFMVSRKGSLLGGEKSLFGNIGFSWKDAKYELGSTLRNTVGEARKLEATMIAMKLRQADTTIRFDRILIHSLSQSSSQPRAVALAETLPVLKKLFSHPKASDFMPTSYAGMTSNTALFSPATYSQDFAKSYHDLLDDALNFRDKQLLAEVEDYNKGKIAQQQVEGAIIQRLADLHDIADTTPNSTEQKRLLSEMLFQIRNVPTHPQPVSKYFERWASMPQNIANQVIQDVVLEFRNSLARVRSQFWEGYKKDFNKTIAALFSSSGNPLSKVGDYTISNTTRYYDPLMQKVEYKTFALDKSGKQYEKRTTLNNFSLLAEDSSAFDELTPEQQTLIRKFNDTIQKGAQLMGIEWVRGRIPLVRASFYNKFHRFAKGEEGAYQGLLQRAFNSLDESFSTGLDDNSRRPTTLQNRFENQANTETADNKRLQMLGISPDNFVQSDKHAEFETNLEVVADMFMMEAIRIQEYNKTAGLFNAAESLFEWQKSKLFDERIGVNLDWLKVWKDAQLHMRDQDSGTVQAKGVNALNKMASITLITKPSVGFAAYLSQQLAVFSQAAANSVGSTSDFGLANWTKAQGIIVNPQNYRKVDLLLDQYGMFNLSMADMTNGHRRYGNKSIFRLKYMYGLLNIGDWQTRGQMLIAQMLKHGNWDAYSVVDDKLVYDEKRDGRFNGTTIETAKGKALREVTAKELQQQGIPLNADGSLPRAYGSSEGNYLKNLADQTVGGFDRESRALYSFYALGKFMGLFKTWLPARLNAMFDKSFTSRLNGSWQFEKKADGNYTALWTGRETEGILQTLLYLGWYVKKYRENPYQKLTPQQKNNLRIATTHAIVLSTVTLAALAFEGGDDDKDPWRLATAKMMHRSLGDIIATYNVFALKDFLYTPIAIVFLDRTITQTFNVLSGEKDINKKTLSRMVNSLPLANSFNEIYSTIDQEQPKH